MLPEMLGPSMRQLSVGRTFMQDGNGTLARKCQLAFLSKLAPAFMIGHSSPSPIPSGVDAAACMCLTSLSLNETLPLVASLLCTALSHLSLLQTLCLKKLDLNDACAAKLASSLDTMQALCSLDVSNNRIHDRGMVAIAAALPPLRNLENLMLQHNFHQHSGCMAIFLAVQDLPRLKRVDLGFGERKDLFVARLKELPRLLELSL
jgi:hypothetical protein